MALALRVFPSTSPPLRRSRQNSPATTITNCSPDPTPTFDLDRPPRKSLISPSDRRSSALDRPEPPNFEIGWKRTKETQKAKPKGWVIADFLEKLDTLMEREYGSKELLAKVGAIVAERAREETEILLEKEKVDERLVTELYRVLRLMEMDFEMVKAAVKKETLAERIQQAKVRCRQAILVALSF